MRISNCRWRSGCRYVCGRCTEPSRSGRLRDGLLTGLFLALQTLSSWYYGIFLATYLVPVGVVLLAGSGRDEHPACGPPLVAGAVLAGVLVLPFAIPYFEARRTVGERPLEEIKFYSATPINYLAAHPRNALYRDEDRRLGPAGTRALQGLRCSR